MSKTSSYPGLRQFLWLFLALMLAMLLAFAVAQALDPPFLRDANYLLQQPGWLAALLGVALLVFDVVAPVPSSMIMFANGLLFGSLAGAALSLAGGLGAAWCGYWIGRQGQGMGQRYLGADALAQGQALFARWGRLGVIVSRPIPLLAEAVSIAAGMAGMPRSSMLAASALGLLPAALLYAVAGAWSLDLNYGLLIFGGVVLLAGVTWLVGRRQLQPPDPGPPNR